MDSDSYSLLRHHLSHIRTPETEETTVDEVLQTLWKTRKTGLKSQEKLQIREFLGLSSEEQLNPILACLRLLIRKCVCENASYEDILKLFPLDSSPECQDLLVGALQKHQAAWKEEASHEQSCSLKAHSLCQTNSSTEKMLPVLIAAELPCMWSRKQDIVNHIDICAKDIAIAEPNMPQTDCMQLQQENLPLDSKLALLPQLKSMTWTVENDSAKPVNRIAVITLKLTNRKSLGETEVKFQLSGDTLDAMLRSVDYVYEQLAETSVEIAEPISKKQCI